MGRAPCCDKANVKRGPWSPEEDLVLKEYLEKNGSSGNWISLPQKAGLKRCGKSCRLRWLNYLRPDIKHGGYSAEEDRIICTLYKRIGSRWSVIAGHLPGRTDNDVKNYWNTKLKKKLMAAAPPRDPPASTGPPMDAPQQPIPPHPARGETGTAVPRPVPDDVDGSKMLPFVGAVPCPMLPPADAPLQQAVPLSCRFPVADPTDHPASTSCVGTATGDHRNPAAAPCAYVPQQQQGMVEDVLLDSTSWGGASSLPGFGDVGGYPGLVDYVDVHPAFGAAVDVAYSSSAGDLATFTGLLSFGEADQHLALCRSLGYQSYT